MSGVVSGVLSVACPGFEPRSCSQGSHPWWLLLGALAFDHAHGHCVKCLPLGLFMEIVRGRGGFGVPSRSPSRCSPKTCHA